MIKGYNNFVSTLKLVRKHRPFAENDNLPKISQPEDHIEVSSPRSTDSEEENLSQIEGTTSENQALKTGVTEDPRTLNSIDVVSTNNYRPTPTGDDPLSDPSESQPEIGGINSLRAAEMGPNCNLKSMFSDS